MYTARIVYSEGAGAFLNPPGHPEHTVSVETDIHLHRNDRGWMSLSHAVQDENIPDDIRQKAQRILDAWVANKLPLTDRAVNLWLRRVFAYFRHCYRGPGDEPQCWYADRLEITHEPRPRELSAAFHLITQYYPEFTGDESDYPEGCADCGHHVNAHANGDGGKCTVITGQVHDRGDRRPYAPEELCSCAQFR